MNPKYDNILVTTDLSENSARAFEHVDSLVALIGNNKAKVTVLHVFEDATAEGGTPLPGHATIEASGMMDRSFAAASAELKALCDKRFEKIGVERKIVRTGRPCGEAILKYAREHDIGLIVMATEGASGFKDLLLGSTAEQVLRGAPCPILLIPVSNPPQQV